LRSVHATPEGEGQAENSAPGAVKQRPEVVEALDVVAQPLL
jgi:hypothetical protein